MAAPPEREIRAWDRFLTRGVRRVSCSPGLNLGSLPVGESRCLASTFALPIAHTGAGGEIEAGRGGEGTAFQMERGTSGWIDCAGAWICGSFNDWLISGDPRLSLTSAPLCRAG